MLAFPESLKLGSFGFSMYYDKKHPGPHYISHVTDNLFAIMSLVILGDNLERLDRSSLLAGLSRCQLENGW